MSVRTDQPSVRALQCPSLSLTAACVLSAGDLFQQLSLLTKFTEGEAARLARQIVSAVGHLHDHGIVHCDLKPSILPHTHPLPSSFLCRYRPLRPQAVEYPRLREGADAGEYDGEDCRLWPVAVAVLSVNLRLIIQYIVGRRR